MAYLLTDKQLRIEAHTAETYRAIRGPAAGAFEAVRLVEFLLDVSPDDGSLHDGLRINALRSSLAMAYGDFSVQAFESAAAEFYATVKARADDGDAMAVVALTRFPRDRDRHVATLRTNALGWLNPGPARAAFTAATKLRALRTHMAKLYSAGGVTLDDVFRVAHLWAEAKHFAQAAPTPATIRARCEACVFLRGHAEIAPAVNAALDVLDARGFSAVVTPRSRQPLAERRAYMRDYMKAYRERRKAAKAAGTANATPPAEAIDPLS